MPRIIFHTPYALNPSATSASGIRPVRMRDAFVALGYEVIEVTGTQAERRARIADVKRRIAGGLDVAFVYSEAATAPTGFDKPFSFATSLSRDVRFLRFCREAGIPVGLFYRDIYWQFAEYAERVGKPLAAILRARYRADLRGYERAVDRIFLPSMRMAEYLPVANRPAAAALPPGAEKVDGPAPEGGVSLFYVGGTGGYYRMQETVRGVEAATGARLTICTRESEWAESAPLYRDVIGASTTVVHRSGPELEALYADAHIGALLMEPMEYREFAAPMKLYEYLGHAKPIIATAGSLAGEFVEEHGIGWAIPYEAGALTELLERLAADPALLAAKVEAARTVREQHTWQARARQAADALRPAG